MCILQFFGGTGNYINVTWILWTRIWMNMALRFDEQCIQSLTQKNKQHYKCFVSDNAYDAADKWLLKENLPLAYRQQIVEFILQNTGQKDFSLDPSFRDPFTGCEYHAIFRMAL